MSHARYIIGDIHEVLASLPDGSVDCVMTSPPFLQLREYLPPDHPDKHLELGRETTPADFIDSALGYTAELGRVLAPHGSLCVELGDTHSGSGGAGGDYAEDGWREGQPKFAGAGAAARDGRSHNAPRAARARGSAERPGGGFRPNHGAEELGQWSTKKRNLNPPPDWPLAKSLSMVPELYRVALAYGLNPLTGAPSPAGLWIARNVVRWVRTNPPVGADGDKYRRATTEMVVATRAADRYFDGVAVRTPRAEGGTAPLQDWWNIPTEGFEGAHYATFPRKLVELVVKSLVPHRVCTTCGEPSRRITEQTPEYKAARAAVGGPTTHTRQDMATGSGGIGSGGGASSLISNGVVSAAPVTVGWSDCGHDSWRRGIVLDPFGGSGTTGAVATGLGRDAILIDIDARNAELALARIGPLFLTVEEGLTNRTGERTVK